MKTITRNRNQVGRNNQKCGLCIIADRTTARAAGKELMCMAREQLCMKVLDEKIIPGRKHT